MVGRLVLSSSQSKRIHPDDVFSASFNGSLWNECLNIHWFLSLESEQGTLNLWRVDYIHERIHYSLNNMTLAELIRSLRKDVVFLRNTTSILAKDHSARHIQSN